MDNEKIRDIKAQLEIKIKEIENIVRKNRITKASRIGKKIIRAFS